MNRLPWFLRWLATSLAAVVVLTIALVLKGAGQPEPLPAFVTAAPSSTSAAQPRLSRILVALTDDAGHVTGVALLARSQEKFTVFTIDPNVAVDFGDAGFLSLASMPGPPSPTALQRGIEQQTGVALDATMVVGRLAFAGLIDRIGGVDVVSNRELLVGDPLAPTAVHIGTSHLQGAAAADYAQYLAPGESESARIPRFYAVLRAACSGLPVEQGQRDDVLNALGSLTQTNSALADLGEFLSAINTTNQWATAQVRTIPTAPSDLESVDGSSWLRMSISSEFAPDVLTNATESNPVRVQVIGGTSRQRLAVRDALRLHGYWFVDGGAGIAVASTTVTMKASAQQVELSALFADLEITSLAPSVAVVPGLACDVVIQLGDDYLQMIENLERK